MRISISSLTVTGHFRCLKHGDWGKRRQQMARNGICIHLMSEHHIRYGDWGGLGYYLMVDDYIALFSRFSTCGSWEGHYILDFVTETDASLHPELVHADTQG